MGMYRVEWECCGSVTETDAWEPENCPFCEGSHISSLQQEQLTQAIHEATARALEAAANEADRWQSAIHDPRYECDCATAIRNLIGRVK